MLIVGLTGGIASGKSTVSSRLKEKHQLTIVDADLIARQVVAPGKKAYKKIVAAFRKDIPDLLLEDKALNRAALGAYVFSDRTRLKKLNGIVHPAVRREICWQIFRAYIFLKGLVILDVPLLYESGLDRICGLVINVSCKKELSIVRLLNRNPELSQKEAQDRIDSQMSNEEKNYRADLVIDNSGTLDHLKKAIDSVAKEIKPNTWMTMLDWFPPIAILSAIYTYWLRAARDKFQGGKPKME